MNLYKSQSAIMPYKGALALLACAFLSMSSGALSEELSEKNFDYLVEIEAKQVEGYLKYTDSKFGNFYKLLVQSSDMKTKEKVKYEELYACSKLGEKPALIGIKRLAPLQKEMKKKRIAMLVKFSAKSPKEEEITAASYGVAPVLVDLLLNDNFAGSIFVPTDVFFAFKQALNSHGFQPAAQVVSANTSLVNIQLQSQPEGRHEAMFYYPSLKK